MRYKKMVSMRVPDLKPNCTNRVRCKTSALPRVMYEGKMTACSDRAALFDSERGPDRKSAVLKLHILLSMLPRGATLVATVDKCNYYF